MDIIECLLSLGSATVNSMISTSERYSKDERFTSEGREYYKELNQALTMANGNLEEYKAKRNSSAFEKLYASATSNSKLNAKKSSVNTLKVYTLIEAYFGIYRDKLYNGRKMFHFFGQKPSGVLEKVMEYIKYPYGVGKKEYNLTPILAICTVENGDAFSENTVVFCEEGIAFDFKAGYFNVIPYGDVMTVCKRTKKFLFLNRCYVFMLNTTGDFSMSYVMERTFPPGAELTGCGADDRDLIAYSIYDFIRCFNPNCTYEERKG